MDLLKKTVEKNPRLIKAAVALQRSGDIPADTYVLDLDTIVSNGTKGLKEATRVGLECYMCTKQFGRNPVVVDALLRSGYEKAIAMDLEGIKNLHRYGVPIAHVGHFGQIPTSELEFVLDEVRPDVFTIYSIERAKQISKVAGKLGIKQKLLVRVVDDPRTERLVMGGGLSEDEAFTFARQLQKLDNVEVVGATSYPATAFSIINKTHQLSGNFMAMMRVIGRMQKELGIEMEQANAPGRNCVATMAPVADGGGTHVEPGQSFLGTLPAMAFELDSPEIPAVVYVTEISHHFGGHAIAFGDSFMATATLGSLRNDINTEYVYALVGDDPDKILDQGLTLARPQEHWHNDLGWSMYAVLMPGSRQRANVGDTVVYGFRPQIYRTPKGRIAVVAGIQRNKPKLVGLFDRAGLLLERKTDDPVGYNVQQVRTLIKKS
jgi:predicted amino acid racemase